MDYIHEKKYTQKVKLVQYNIGISKIISFILVIFRSILHSSLVNAKTRACVGGLEL